MEICYAWLAMTSPRIPAFGELDLRFEDDAETSHGPRAPSRPPSFGRVELDLGDDAEATVVSRAGVAEGAHEGGRVPMASEIRQLRPRGDADLTLALAAYVADEGRWPASDARGAFDERVGPDAEDGTAIVASTHRASWLPAMVSRRGQPRVVMMPEQLTRLALDHRAGFLLVHIDGMTSMEEILDVCAMPEAEALEIIERLAAMGVIVLG